MFRLSPRNLELNNDYFLYVSFPFLCIPSFVYSLLSPCILVITVYLCPPHVLSSASVPHLSGSGHA